MGISQSSFENQPATTLVGTFIIGQASFDYAMNTIYGHKSIEEEQFVLYKQNRNIAIMMAGAILIESHKYFSKC